MAGPEPEAGSTVNVGIAAEPDDYDGDSALGGDSFASSTTSLSSSILKNREENGRTYHAYKAGKYFLPNDEGENDRLDLQHHVFSLTFNGKLYLAPLDKNKIHRVLDAGTGTGIWAIDFADEHPGAKVLGIDLSPIQPNFLPPNLTFEVDDLEEPWTYAEKFDFIYARMMTGSLVDYLRFFTQAMEFLNPGGYIEIVDVLYPIKCDDGSLKPDSALNKWSEFMLEASIKFGRPINSVAAYKSQLEQAGFADIVQEEFKWPINKWPRDKHYKELGLWTCENVTSALSGISLALFTRALGWSAEEVEAFCVDVRKDMKDTTIHSYWSIYVTYARKPVQV